MKRFLTTLAALLALALPAAAANISVTSITGTWDNVTGTTATGEGTSTISWGGGTAQSSYVFAGEATPFNVLSSPFDIGTFTHNNYPISPPSITGADLTVTVSGLIDGSAFSMGGVYRFAHTETPNSANPCAEGGSIPCPDKVTLVGAVSTFGDQLNVNNELVSLSLVGFTGGVDFLTAENASNSAKLQAEFTSQVNVIPVPAGAILLPTALMGFAALRRRKRRAA